MKEKLENYLLYLAVLAILFQNYLKGAKTWWLFAQLYKNAHGLFQLCVDLKIETVMQTRERK